jgi:UDP-N-acetylglucosamine acyltransferase
VIHPTAIIASRAKLDPTVRVGPYAVIDEDVQIGAGCVIGSHVYITGRTAIGRENHFFTGCVIGEAPQDLGYKNEDTGLHIGNHNIFREHVTVHRSSKLSEDTVIGNDNFLMQHSHVAHNAVLGDRVIVAGGALLAGHVNVGDRAFISGNCLVHQFVRVGAFSLMQGGSAISKDLPPYTMARGYNGICGLNTVGMRRAGFSSAERLELKQLYHSLFRNGLNLRAALAEARKSFSSPRAMVLLDFISTAKRSICVEVGGVQIEKDDNAE